MDGLIPMFPPRQHLKRRGYRRFWWYRGPQAGTFALYWKRGHPTRSAIDFHLVAYAPGGELPICMFLGVPVQGAEELPAVRNRRHEIIHWGFERLLAAAAADPTPRHLSAVEYGSTALARSA